MNDAQHIREPELEFGSGSHIDIRFGLRDYGPLDMSQPSQPDSIRLGIVGTPKTADNLERWLEKISSGVESKESKFPNRYVAFPGFGVDCNLSTPVVIDESTKRTIQPRQLKQARSDRDINQAIEDTADLFLEELGDLAQSKNVDVLFCAPPSDVFKLKQGVPPDGAKTENSENDSESNKHDYRVDFHDLVKAKGLLFSCPIQFIWPPTYTGEKIDLPGRETYPLQDEATRAWNLYVGLYYKAGGIPWRLVRNKSDLATCFVGVRFYKSLDREQAHGSAAQIFNERGEGLIMQGGPAERSEEDRQLHLNKDDSKELLEDTLRMYRREHGHPPARLVLHKTSPFNRAEREGFWEAAESEKLNYMDLIHVRRSTTRLFRKEYHPPLRGTLLSLDRRHNYLYTVGSINFYQMIFSNRVPRTLQFDIADASSPPRKIGEEILKLTKMNWNNTQISQMMPVTVDAANKVGSLLKYVDREEISSEAIAPNYSYYM